MWFEEQVGTNHRMVFMVGGFGANVQYWQLLADGNIYGSTKGSVSFLGTSDSRFKHDIKLLFITTMSRSELDEG